MRAVALPYASLSQIGHMIGSASRATHYSIWPAQFDHELVTVFVVLEVNNRFSESTP
jgi:hypothetical protein